MPDSAIRLDINKIGAEDSIHVGAVDTDMMAGFDVDKNDPAEVVHAALDGLEAGAVEVLAEEAGTQTKATHAVNPRATSITAMPTT